MLLEAIVLSLIIGFIRGGKLRGLKRFKKKTFWFLILGILVQGAIVIGNNFVQVNSVGKILTYSKEILILSYLLILIGIISNYDCRSLWISLIGYIMNFIVLLSNNWKKPILMEGLKLTKNLGLIDIINSGAASIYTPLVEGTKHPVLANYIVFSKPYFLTKVVSIGDFIIAIGIFILIQDFMKENNRYGLRF